MFAVPTSHFMQYQLRQVLPYYIKRWIFFQRSATLKPLYQFEENEHPNTNKDVKDRVIKTNEGDYGTNSEAGHTEADRATP